MFQHSSCSPVNMNKLVFVPLYIRFKDHTLYLFELPLLIGVHISLISEASLINFINITVLRHLTTILNNIRILNQDQVMFRS